MSTDIWQECQEYTMGERQSVKMLLRKLDVNMQKNEIGTLYKTINSKQIKDKLKT